MKKQEMGEFKTLLVSLRSRYRGDVQQLTNEALGSKAGETKSPTHMAEMGSDTFEQDFALSLVENEQETLDEIAAALDRIVKGTFGSCGMCLEDGKTSAKSSIAKARLRAIPYARHCIECERKLEEFV